MELSIVDLLYRYLQKIETTEGDDNAIIETVSRSLKTVDLVSKHTQKMASYKSLRMAPNTLDQPEIDP